MAATVPAAAAGSDYSTFDKPAVWRHNREAAQARVAAMEDTGSDRYDIPAFLRKQAD
jgi:cell division protein FtsZ